MIERHTSTSFFLIDHPAVVAFTSHVRAGRLSDPLFPFAIVCERKEDVISLRAQLFEALKAPGSRGTALGCGTVYTLDSLGQALTQWAHLALRVSRAADRLGSLTPADLRRPYLDVVTQEKLAEQIFYHMGYTGTDGLPLAKQVLTLLDTPLPPETSLFEVLVGQATNLSRSDERKGAAGAAAGARVRVMRERGTEQTGHQALTFLLAALQATRSVMGRFSRLQSLVSEGFSQTGIDVLAALIQALPFAPALLRGAVLWLEAPSYSQVTAADNGTATLPPYRPGNFPSHITQGVRDACLHLRRLYSQQQMIDLPAFVLAETAIRAPSEPLDHSQHHLESVTVYPSPDTFFRAEPFASVEARASSSPLALLGDVETGLSTAVRSLGFGSHAASLHDKTTWVAAQHRGGCPRLPKAVAAALEEAASDHRKLEGLLEPSLTELASIAGAYGLGNLSRSKEQRFLLSTRSLRYRVGPPHPLEDLPRALAFWATTKRPEAIVVFGRPHAPRSASLNVRFLNSVFFRLVCAGVDVELPASDLMYRSFWKNLLMNGIPLQFVLPGPEDQKELDAYLSAPKDTSVHSEGQMKIVRCPAEPIRPRWESHPWAAGFLQGGLYPSMDPDWQAHRRLVRSQKKLKKGAQSESGTLAEGSSASASVEDLGMTAFEDYVLCPFKFYLQHVLGLEDRSADTFAPDPLVAGTQIHAALERLTTVLNLWLSACLHLETEKQCAAQRLLCDLLAAWRDALFEPTCFATRSRATWLEAFRSALESVTSISTTPPGGAEHTPASDKHRLAAELLASKHLLERGVEAALEPVFAGLEADSFDRPTDGRRTLKPKRNSPQDRLPLTAELTREAKKRYFVRYLHAEVERLLNDDRRNTIRHIAFTEEQVTLGLGPLRLRGRIDRIDLVRPAPEPGADSDTGRLPWHELLDYKTSRPPREETELVLSSNGLLNPAKQKLSVQGGLYLLAWADRLTAKGAAPVNLTFSLYRLGSLDWSREMLLTASLPFTSPEEAERELNHLRRSYTDHAERLHAGHFPAHPLAQSHCGYCSFSSLCPTGRGQLSQTGAAVDTDPTREDDA